MKLWHLVVGLALAFQAAAQPLAQRTLSSDPARPDDMRLHMAWFAPSGSVAYAVTRIVQSSETRTATTYLIEDSQGDRYILLHILDWSGGEVRAELRHVESKTYLALSMRMLVKGSTRTEILEAWKKAARPRPEEEVFTAEAGGLTRTASVGEWEAYESANEWRRELRRSAGTKVVEGLEAMRAGLLPTQEFQPYCTIFLRYFLYGDAPCASTTVLKQELMPPDCDFDDGFGYGCSDRQKERVETARKELRQISTY